MAKRRSDTAHVLASWLGEHHGEKLEYDMRGTPCQETASGTPTFYSDRMSKLSFRKMSFSGSLMLKVIVEFRYSAPMERVIGHLAVMDDKPMQQDFARIAGDANFCCEGIGGVGAQQSRAGPDG